MQFDFYERYKDYPNTELQKITQQPSAYQPEAVDAALRLLKERGVRDDSIHLLDSFEITEEIKMPKLLVFFLALLALEYFWKIYSTVTTLFRDTIVFQTSVIISSSITFAYNAFVFYLLLKRKPWGWILAFVNASVFTSGRIMSLNFYLKYIRPDTAQGIIFIATFLLNLSLTIYLWQKEAVEFFDITIMIKRRTALVVISIIVVIALSRL